MGYRVVYGEYSPPPKRSYQRKQTLIIIPVTANPQPQSRLCQLPHEILFQSAGHQYADSYSEYSDSNVITKPSQHTHHLGLIRCCRRLREILRPVLASYTKTLIVNCKYNTSRKPSHDQINAIKINMNQLFRAHIRDLDLTKNLPLYPTLSLFPGLKRLHMRLRTKLKPDPTDLRNLRSTDDWLVSVIKTQINKENLRASEFCNVNCISRIRSLASGMQTSRDLRLGWIWLFTRTLRWFAGREG